MNWALVCWAADVVRRAWRLGTLIYNISWYSNTCNLNAMVYRLGCGELKCFLKCVRKASAAFVVRGTSASSICDVAHRLEGKRASSDAQQSLPFAQMSLHKCITRTSLRYRAWHVCASWRRFCVQTACHTRLSGTIPADMLHVVRTCIFTRCVAWLEMYELARAISSRFEPDHCAMPFEPTPTVHCVLNKAMLQGNKVSGSAA